MQAGLRAPAAAARTFFVERGRQLDALVVRPALQHLHDTRVPREGTTHGSVHASDAVRRAKPAR